MSGLEQVHVGPITDSIDHWLSCSCPCGPDLEKVTDDVGQDHLTVRHHALVDPAVWEEEAS